MRWLSLSLLLCALPVSAQTAKTKVQIGCQSRDMVGAMYCSALRDVIAESPRYAERSDGDTDQVGGYWGLSIVTMDDSVGNEKGLRTAISVSILRNNIIFITSMVQTCGRDAVKTCATQTMASLDAAVKAP
jgi:hypothetical protein